MPLPRVNVRQSEITEEWFKNCARAVNSMCSTSYMQKQKDVFCWNLYHGVINDSDFDYLRRVDNYEYPAKVRFIPILRTRFERLKANEIVRPFTHKAFTCNKDALANKMDYKANSLVTLIDQAIMNKITQIQTIKEQIQSKMDSINQMLQGSEGDKPIPPDQQAEIEAMNKQLQLAMRPLTKEELFEQKNIDKLDTFSRMKFKDIYEYYINSGLEYFVEKYDLQAMFVDGIEEKIVTDKPIYAVDIIPGRPDPIFRKVNSLNFYHSQGVDSKYLENADWTKEDFFMTVPEIMDEYGEELSDEDVNKLKGRSLQNGEAYPATYYNNVYPDGRWVDGGNSLMGNSLYAGSVDSSNKLRVARCMWRSVETINVKYSPNKYTGGYFIHWVPDGAKIEDNERIEKRYKVNYYECTTIGFDIFIRMKKVNQPIDVDDPSNCETPYVGNNFDNLTRRPYSLCWATKDIQILYNLVNYHIELWLALSGTKGVVMDRSQKPDGMSDAEWMYQRKLGVAWIQTVKEGIQKQATFNQFQNYDDTITGAIQYLTNYLGFLENLASTITGVTHPMLGEVKTTDQVGTYSQAIQNSTLLMEVLYYDHDQIKKRALKKLVNSFKKTWKDGKQGSYVLGDLGQQILNIPKGEIDKCNYDVQITNGAKEEKQMNDLRGIAGQAYAKGQLQLNGLTKLYTAKTVKEMEAMLDKFADEAMRLMQDNQQGEAQQQQQIAQFQEQLKQQTQAMALKQQTDMEAMRQDLEKAKLSMLDSQFNADLAFREKELSVKSELDMQDIQSKKNVDIAYLNEQAKEAGAEFELNKLELAMKGLEISEKSKSDAAQRAGKNHIKSN
jgi:hypothetical protein